MNNRMHAQLDKIHTFFAVVESGSFTRAADNLGLSKAMVSLHIKALEQALGVTLLARNTRNLALTESGSQLYQDFKAIFSDIDLAVGRVTDDSQPLSGELRITSTWEFGQRFLMAPIAHFCQRHPGLKLSYNVGASLDDLVSHKLDVAIRLGTLRDSSLKSRRLGQYRILLVASPRLIARYPLQCLREVAPLPWIHNSNLSQPGRWQLQHGEERFELKSEASYSANSAQIMRQMALAGMGVAILPEWLIEEDLVSGELQILFPGWQLPLQPISAVFNAGPALPRKTRMFIDYLCSEL
ncbi:LysR family transcriptional regulator [Erwinia sorbitola]|nr:LysR family transcriptional regulator [Erwinia sorbitola]